jgi:hypothetical protein
MFPPNSDKLNEVQLNLLKSFRYLNDVQTINEIDSLINLYFERKLDGAISKAEEKSSYSAAIYEQWLNG